MDVLQQEIVKLLAKDAMTAEQRSEMGMKASRAAADARKRKAKQKKGGQYL